MNILIVKLSAIGDVIHTLPSLSALRRLYPDAHITWVVEEAAAAAESLEEQAQRLAQAVSVFKLEQEGAAGFAAQAVPAAVAAYSGVAHSRLQKAA